ncbi:hypothetical protein AVEN_18633-1 [Araneus ventricosus]|uniref:Uncharacterized protein n=1 Tax=Araneus ventricosus TaxID=182803 RepID=A0A4Y2VDW9_ARAVE|nr:hypothetical protein AVEN_18633-1 [Araneus ventricosus]
MRCSRRVNMPSYEKSYRERSPSRRSVRKSRDFTRSTDCNPNAPSLYIPPLWKKSPFQRRYKFFVLKNKCMNFLSLECNMTNAFLASGHEGKSKLPVVSREKDRFLKNESHQEAQRAASSSQTTQAPKRGKEHPRS